MGFAKTVTLLVGRKLNDKTQEEKSVGIIEHFAPLRVVCGQCWFKVIRVAFLTEAMKVEAMKQKGFHLFGMWVRVGKGGRTLTSVHIFDYPFEGEEAHISEALAFVRYVART